MCDANGTILGLIFGYLVLALGRKNAENFKHGKFNCLYDAKITITEEGEWLKDFPGLFHR